MPNVNLSPVDQKLVIAFQPGRWIRDVTIAVGDLPTEPVLQLRRRADIELRAVIPGDANVRKERERFTQRRPALIANKLNTKP